MFKTPIKHPRGEIKWAVGNVNLVQGLERT